MPGQQLALFCMVSLAFQEPRFLPFFGSPIPEGLSSPSCIWQKENEDEEDNPASLKPWPRNVTNSFHHPLMKTGHTGTSNCKEAQEEEVDFC